MAGKLSGTAIQDGSLAEDVLDPSINVVVDAGARPKITSIVYPNNDLAITALQPTNIELVGSGFKSGLFVYVNGEAAPSVTYNNANSIFATIQALNSGTYPLYVVNPDGGTGILAPGITASFYPTWVTNTTFTVFAADWTYQLNANSDSTITYTLAPGNTLPAGVTLSSNGLLYGALTSPPLNDTTYTFSVVATDTELQSETRQFSATSLARIAATGGEIINVGAYRIHTFNTSGTFEVTGGAGEIEYLVVAGGGAGGSSAGRTGRSGGGGGAGGYRISSNNYVAGNSYVVIVGGGGSLNANGSISSFDGLVSAGGGYGGSDNGPGKDGGSGGGGGSATNESNYAARGSGGLGNVPATSPAQGNNGATGSTSQQYGHRGGGGGGAGGVGSTFVSPAGGAGANSDISGTIVTRARGGNGGLSGVTATAGASGTGNGGNAGYDATGAAGGSGTVILRYLI